MCSIGSSSTQYVQSLSIDPDKYILQWSTDVAHGRGIATSTIGYSTLIVLSDPRGYWLPELGQKRYAASV
jgi:hypothetical protein